MAELSGALTHDTVPGLATRAEALGADDVLDLSGVERVDSSAVALLLEIRRRKGQPLRLQGVPPHLQSLIACFGVGELLTATPET